MTSSFHTRWPIRLATITAGSLALAGFTWANVGAQAVTSVTSTASPFQAAAASGDRVEITSERTETETVWANPDGTQTFELNNEPVRVRDENDQWVKPDYDLEFDGGVVVPKAGDTDLALSDGGDGMVRLEGDEDATLALDWPGTLPRPTLDGPTATYEDVLPDVDLLMTAVPGGYRQVLRVNTPEAAQNPELDRLDFGADVSAGATLEETPSGGIEVKAADGHLALVGTQPTMWDSSGTEPESASEQVPDEGDKVRNMGLAADEDSVVVVPDQELLNSSNTVYPVYIDPTIHEPALGGTGRTMVQKEYPSTEFYNWDNNDGYGEGVGYQNASGVSTKRIIFEYSLASIPAGSTIAKAEFRAAETHSWSCTATNVNLDRVGLISSATNWNNQPGKINNDGPLATSNIQVRSGGTGACKPTTTWLSFGLDAADYLDTAVQNAAYYDAIALRLSATESSPLGWKRFLNNAVLQVTINRPPSTPTSLSMADVENGRNACVNWVPVGVGQMPNIQGRITDPDGDKMDGRFDIFRWNGSSWVNLGSWWVMDLASGSMFKRDLPISVVRPSTTWIEAEYAFNLTGRDQYTDFKAVARTTIGTTSGLCPMFVDAFDPKVSMSATLKRIDGSTRPALEDEWLAPGQTLTLRFDPSGSLSGYDNKNDVVAYKMTSDVPALNTTVPVSLGAVGTYDIDTSMYRGEHWVNVQSVDRAGRTSQIVTRFFRVQGAVQTARYTLDEAEGSSAHGDTAGNPVFDLSGAHAPTWEIQHTPEEGLDTYLRLDGAGGGTATTPVVDDTQAFSVSAWVKADDVTTRRVVASQRTASGRAFALAIEPGCGTGNACAVFTIWDSDGIARSVTSTVPVVSNHWYVLAGSFDDMGPLVAGTTSRSHQIRVWVADSQGTPAVPATSNLGTTFTPAAATGSDLGQESLGASAGSFWSGDIEDVRFYTDEVSWDDVSAHLGTDPFTNQ